MSSNMEIPKKCMNCGRAFTARTTRTRYCSHRCNQVHYKKVKRKEKIELAKEKKEVTGGDNFLLTIPQAASLAGISERTVFRLIERNIIEPLRFGRRVVIPKTELIKI